MSTVQVAAHNSFGRLPVLDRGVYLADICRHSKAVLHVGATGHDLTPQVIGSPNWLHGHLAKVSQRIVGFDIDAAACGLMRSYGYEMIEGDAETLDVHLERGEFDLVVAAEIIEHLFNPGRFLTAVRNILSPHEGRLVITTPNALRWLNCAFSLFGREVVNETHVCWYSPVTLSYLLSKHGFAVEEIIMYDQLEPGSPLRHHVFRIIHRAFPLSAPGLVVLAQRRD